MITFRKVESKLVLKEKKQSNLIKGILLTVQEIKLKRKVIGIYFYEIVEEYTAFKPELDVLAAKQQEDVTFAGHARIWLKINSGFDNFVLFQPFLKITKVISPSSDEMLFFLFNHFSKK